MSPTSAPEICPAELKSALESEAPPRLLDVREALELEISRLPGIVHIPLAQLPNALDELDREADWVIVCRSGARSGQAAQFLLRHGFKRVRNLARGMNGYAQEADSSFKVY